MAGAKQKLFVVFLREESCEEGAAPRALAVSFCYRRPGCWAACVYAASEDVGIVGGTGFSLWAFSFPPETSPFSLPGSNEQQPRNNFSLAPPGLFMS